MNRKPVELHLIDGTKPSQNISTIPETLKNRVPRADWLDNPEKWNRKKFVKETSDFLFEVYGIGTDQDKHILAMLADQIESYVDCCKNIREQGKLIAHNSNATIGTNPYVQIRLNTVKTIVQLMSELGLTPRTRLAAQKAQDTPAKRFKAGPKG